MKYGVVDIGSNSVRLMINDNGKTLYKKVKITKLALGMKDGILHNEAVERTVRAVSFFVKLRERLLLQRKQFYSWKKEAEWMWKMMYLVFSFLRSFLVAQMVKSLPAMRESLEGEMATHSNTLVWRIPWTEEPGRLQSMES